MFTTAALASGAAAGINKMVKSTPLNDYRVFINPEIANENEQKLVEALSSQIQMKRPDNYSTEEDTSQQLKRQASFWTQRFLNPGMFNSGSVDRLMFKNQNFIRFIRKDYLFNKGYFGNDREYHELLGHDIFDIGTSVTVSLSPSVSMIGRINKVIHLPEDENTLFYWIEYKSNTNQSNIKLFNEVATKFSQTKDAISNKMGNYLPSFFKGGAEGSDNVPKPLQLPDDPERGSDTRNVSEYQLFQYPIPKELFTRKNSSITLKSFFKLNEEQFVPFINPDFFIFLHIFKYNLKKAYSMGRINLVYHSIKAMGLSMTQKTYTTPEEDAKIKTTVDLENPNYEDGKTLPYDANYYKSFLFAYRQFMTEDLQKVMRTLKYSLLESNKSTLETLKTSKKVLSATPEQQKASLKKIQDANDEEIKKDADSQTTPEINPNTTTKQSGGKTKKNGQKTKITKNTNKTKKMTGGFMRLSSLDPRGVIIDKLAKYIYVDNIKNKLPDDQLSTQPIAYVIEEQKLFLGLAIQYFTALRKNDPNDLELKKLNEKLTAPMPFQNYKESEKNTDSAAIHEYLEQNYKGKTVTELVDVLAKIAFQEKQVGGFFGLKDRGIYSSISSGVSKATNFVSTKIDQATDSLFKNNKKINLIFDYSYKRMIYDRINRLYVAKAPVPDMLKHREQLVDYFKEISWCLLMSAHFTCSTILNFATMWQNPLEGIPFIEWLGIQTPHCYISGVILMVLLYQLGPFSLNILRGIDDLEKKMKENEAARKILDEEAKKAETLNEDKTGEK